MRPQSAATTITHAVTLAAGVFAPGHLGELTQYLPFELVDDVLEQTRTVQTQAAGSALADRGLLPARAGDGPPAGILTQLGEWTRLGFLTRTGAGTYALATPT